MDITDEVLKILEATWNESIPDGMESPEFVRFMYELKHGMRILILRGDTDEQH